MSDIELSVIIPHCNEMPAVAFTTQGLIEELDGFCRYEIILVDNLSHDHLTVKAGEREYPAFSRNYFYNGTTGAVMKTYFFRKGVVRWFKYDAKQGHWNAKNFGIQQSRGKYLFFLDAHCLMKRDSLRRMLTWLRENEDAQFWPMGNNGPMYRVGAVHAYINYMLDSRSLEYKVQRKTFGYQFCTHQVEEYYEGPETAIVHGKTIEVPASMRRKLRFPTRPYQVCVMSTCAMMCPRAVIDELGAWHPEFGIYGGGESYMNWKQSTCGWGHWIHPQAWCWHYADKRGYSWNHTDFVRNAMIARYVVGGDAFLQEEVDLRLKKDNPTILNALAEDVRTKCSAERDFIAGRQVIDIDSYLGWWEAHPGTWA
jgi:glycosyltransferase involved in cell wall biosynthesis